VQTPWGESITVAHRATTGWMSPIYLIVVAAFVYGVVGAVRLWRRDRVGGMLVGVAAGGGVIASIIAAFADVGGGTALYFGDAPSAVWVVMMAMVLSREYADRGEQLAAGERRFRAVFDEASEFVFLTQPDGTLTQANRSALSAIGLAAADVVGRPLWDTPWWNHDLQLRDRVRSAVSDAARGVPVRFEATHPRHDGLVSSADCAIAAVRNDRGEGEETSQQRVQHDVPAHGRSLAVGTAVTSGARRYCTRSDAAVRTTGATMSRARCT
jgi:PAS domain S-box-containing protein